MARLGIKKKDTVTVTVSKKTDDGVKSKSHTVYGKNFEEVMAAVESSLEQMTGEKIEKKKK